MGQGNPSRGLPIASGVVASLLAALATAAVLLASAAQAIAAEPPAATTQGASGVSSTGATLNGKVNPNGEAVAICRFEYGTSPAYGAIAPCVPDSLGTGSFNVSVSAEIGQLEPGTVYHYRLVASGPGGGTQGVDQTFSTPGVPVCPNADRRLEQGIRAIQLPDCMALEQVSPPLKYSQRAASPTISADGNRIGFLSLAALAETPGNISAIFGDSYVAEREDSRWQSAPTSPPFPIVTGWGTGRLLARSFNPELTEWFVLGSSDDQFWSGQATLFRGGEGGRFAPLSPFLDPIGGLAHRRSGVEREVNLRDAQLQGASADHSTAFFAMGDADATYLTGDPVVTAGGDRNVYLAKLDAAGTPSLQLAARDQVGPDAGKAWGGNCGARVGGVGGLGVGWRNQGAVAADGSRAFLSTRAAQPEGAACSTLNKLRIMERVESPLGAEITHLLPADGAGECQRVAPPCSGMDGDDLYQGASVDGKRVYFTSPRQLADSDLDEGPLCTSSSGLEGCDLYLYDAERPSGERLVQVSAGEETAGHPTIGQGAKVLNGTVAISGDGERVYFVAAGVLTDSPNPTGKSASEYGAFDPKLYSWNAVSEETQFVGALSATDSNRLWNSAGALIDAYPVPLTGQNAAREEIGGDGAVLFFLSAAPLTPNDADGARVDVFRYDSEASPPTLDCISCRPGGPDSGPFDATRGQSMPVEAVGTGFAEVGRWASEDGASALIRTDQPLLPSDQNSALDEYLWKDGSLSLLPGASSAGVAAGLLPPVLSHDGSQVAFAAGERLLPSDRDTAPDVYVARAGGGFVNPAVPPACIGEECQGEPSPPPAEGNAATASFAGTGNVKSGNSRHPKRCSKGKRRIKRKGKVRCVKRPTRRKASRTKTRCFRQGPTGRSKRERCAKTTKARATMRTAGGMGRGGRR